MTRRWRFGRVSSLRGRVVLGVLALVAVLLAALFTTVDVILSARLQSDLRTRLTDRAALAAQLDGALSPQQLVDRLRGDGVAALLCSNSSGGSSGGSSDGSSSSGSASSGSTLRCVNADSGPSLPIRGQAPASDSSQPPGTKGRPARPPAPKGAATSTSVESAGPVLFVRTTLPSTGQELTLSVDSSQIQATIHRLVVLEIIGGLITLLVAAVLLGRLVGTALRPLDQMTALARRIAGGDRGRRLGTGRPDTELGRTATAFDDMLDELESALTAAAAAEARLRGFLSDVSHELRTPLTGLAATTETLLRDEPGRAEREDAYVTLVRETRRAGRLVDDLLTVTRLDTGMSLATEPVDLVEVAGHEVSRLRLLAPALAVSLTGVPAAPVDADAVRLGQIVSNLLDNARAAGPTGRITVDVARGDEGWLLDVTDSGPGVPDADRERIFDRLVRLDESRSRSRGSYGSGSSTGGFGLGLPIARALARAHGGELVCLAQPAGTGARFRLTLPARTGAVTPASSPQPPITPSGPVRPSARQNVP